MKVFRAIGRSFSKGNDKLKSSFSKIREEFDEHLQSINENTTEIAQNHEYLCELEQKMEKVAERLDHIELFLTQYGYGRTSTAFTVRPLSNDEKHVFVALYAVEDEKGHVTYADIAKALLMDIQLVGGYIASLMEKGVPIVKRYANDIAYLKLDSNFKRLQAKENLLSIDKAQRQLVGF